MLGRLPCEQPYQVVHLVAHVTRVILANGINELRIEQLLEETFGFLAARIQERRCQPRGEIWKTQPTQELQEPLGGLGRPS